MKRNLSILFTLVCCSLLCASCAEKEDTSPPVLETWQWISDSVLVPGATLSGTAQITDNDALLQARATGANSLTAQQGTFVNTRIFNLSGNSFALQYDYLLPDTLFDGPYTLSLEAADSEGNLTSELIEWFIDSGRGPQFEASDFSATAEDDSLVASPGDTLRFALQASDSRGISQAVIRLQDASLRNLVTRTQSYPDSTFEINSPQAENFAVVPATTEQSRLRLSITLVNDSAHATQRVFGLKLP